MDAFAIHTSLRSHLGTNGKLLKGFQSIRTGLALLPVSTEALPALEAQEEAIAAFFKDCQIERSSRWISYRVTSVPRKVGQLTGSQHSMIPVNPEILSSVITEAIGLNPVSITETGTSAANPNSISSSWFINFPEDSKANLPVRLSLFGMITNAQPLVRRTKVVQCNRCWKWHNARSCARQPRCRLCGSTQHTEEAILIDAVPNLPTPALQGAYTAMAPTRLTMSNASCDLARQALDAQRPSELRFARLAP
jgi:hypothetical protein